MPKAAPSLTPPRPLKAVLLALAALGTGAVLKAATTTQESFARQAQPILEDHCYDCHGDGASKGGVRLDGFSAESGLRDHTLWLRVMKNVRAGLMPPSSEPRLSPEEKARLLTWIKRQAFSLDPEHPDPGRVTLRRLNRAEYRNSVRELTGVDFDTQKEFPADDTGQGFDNIADVLTISPMLLERYLDAAQTIVSQSVPVQRLVVAKTSIPGKAFAAVGPTLASEPQGPFKRPAPKVSGTSMELSYYTAATVAATFEAVADATYGITFSLKAVESYVDDQFDLNRCRLTLFLDGKELSSQEFVRESDKDFTFDFERSLAKGVHTLALRVEPLGPDREQKRALRLRLASVTVAGPEDSRYWVQADNYERFFPRKVPWWSSGKKKYAAEILGSFASRAFRRPADADTVERLVKIADSVSSLPGGTFEAGVAQAMVAVLASPRFIFRQEQALPLGPGQVYPQIDEYSLASRLSYFLWSSMPDAELFRLAGEGQLRAHLKEQVGRMLRDPRSEEFVRNFTGQWLEARDVANVQINPFAVYLREHPNPEAEEALDTFRKVGRIPDDKRSPEEKEAFQKARKVFLTMIREPKPQLTESLRTAMRRESEMVFSYVIHDDRSLVELVESDYTFLNEELAKHYGIAGVEGKQMRKVTLAPGSPRGGVITQATVLAVTSNPTRTSPVKRGVFILDNILGTRPPPPPPNIPALEDAASPEKLRRMTLRENLSLHATNKMCASCHSRMDPLGLALENFNAMGMWRDGELNRPIDASGKLITGEHFADIRDLKHILATKHRDDFYYCITEKLLTYAIGRTLDYYDVDTVDSIVEKLDQSGGRSGVLIESIIESPAFDQVHPAAPVKAPSADLKKFASASN